MSKLLITSAGINYKDAGFAGAQGQNITKFVFANVPNLQETDSISATTVVPVDHVVHEQPTELVSRLDDNAVVMSAVLGYEIGTFDYNWFGAIATLADNSEILIAVVHSALQTKTKTVGANAGNYSVKSIVWRSNAIAANLNVNLSVLPWQVDSDSFMSKVDIEQAFSGMQEDVDKKLNKSNLSSSVTSASNQTAATSNAVKQAYDKAAAAAPAGEYMVFKGDIGGGEDLNSYKETGIYDQSNNAGAISGVNYPVLLAGKLDVFTSGIKTYQEYTAYDGKGKYTRTCYNGDWYPWKTIIHNNSLSSSVTSTSNQAAATSNAVKQAYDKANDALLGSVRNARASTEGGSMKAFTKAGRYRIINATLDLPPLYASGLNDFFIDVFSLDGLPTDMSLGGFVRIVAYDVHSSAVWELFRRNGAWSTWKKRGTFVYDISENANQDIYPYADKIVVSVYSDGNQTVNIKGDNWEAGQELVISNVLDACGQTTITSSLGIVASDQSSGGSHTATGRGVVNLIFMGSYFRVV